MKDARIYLVAGEVSGDMHAASLVTALRQEAPHWSFVGLGGEAMAAAGVELRENLVERSANCPDLAPGQPLITVRH